MLIYLVSYLIGIYRRIAAPTPDECGCIGRGRSAWCRKVELSCSLIQNTKGLPHVTYALHPTPLWLVHWRNCTSRVAATNNFMPMLARKDGDAMRFPLPEDTQDRYFICSRRLTSNWSSDSRRIKPERGYSTSSMT